MIKDIRKNWKFILYSILYGLITYSLYFQPHYVHDSYRIYNFGFLQNLKGFWTQGRVASLGFNVLFNFLNISASVGQKISILLTIIFLALSSLLVYIIIKRKVFTENGSKKLQITLFLICNGLFFNVYITDWMMFLESCVIALGCLLSVVACYFLTTTDKKAKKYLLTTLFLTLGIFCYQASIAIGGALVIMITIYDNRDKKILDIIKILILSMIPYAIALLLNFAFIKVVNLNNLSDARLAGSIDILYNLKFVIKQFTWCFIAMFNYPTKYIVAILVFSAFIFYVIKVVKEEKSKICILYVAVSMLCLCILSVLPIMAMPSSSIYFISRSVPYIASMLPFLLLCILTFSKDTFDKNETIFYIITIIYTFIVTISVIKVTSECLKNNAQDINIAKTIQLKIDEYENDTGNKVDTIILVPDKTPSLSENNITYYSDNTVRAFFNDYSVKEIMYFVSQRYYNVTESTNEEEIELFGDFDFDSFDIQELKFNENVLYLVKY